MFDQGKRKKIEGRRRDIQSAIRGERLAFESMVQRAEIAAEPLFDPFLASVRQRLEQLVADVSRETDLDELDSLEEDAERQGQLRAYICPRAEIRDEGVLAIDLMAEWNVPKAVIVNLRGSLGPALKKADKDLEAARGALRAIFEEQDSWRRYTSDYEDEMLRFTRWWLSVPTMILIVMAVLALRYFPLIIPFAVPILFAGAAGSCVSIMAKMPVLDVSPSGELESYERRILARIGVGIIGSMIGCGFLGWGLISISIHGQTYGEILNACSTAPLDSCSGLNTLIILSIPILFGFSERALISFERKVFGPNGPK